MDNPSVTNALVKQLWYRMDALITLVGAIGYAEKTAYLCGVLSIINNKSKSLFQSRSFSILQEGDVESNADIPISKKLNKKKK